MNDENLTLEDQMSDDDWALIIGSDGSLRGVFIPAAAEEADVPESVVTIMSTYFGVDFDDEENYRTIH